MDEQGNLSVNGSPVIGSTTKLDQDGCEISTLETEYSFWSWKKNIHGHTESLIKINDK